MPFKKFDNKPFNPRSVFAFLFLIPMVALSGCQQRSDVKVRLTATVSSDGKLYSGSSVQAYRCRKSTGIMNDLSDCLIDGEAVVVDIPQHGNLFLVFDVPLKRSRAEMVRSLLTPVSADPMRVSNDDLPAQWFLTEDQMPMMVTFKDPRNPFSVTLVDPKNLSGKMGPGVSLTSVKVQKSSEDVTFGKVENVIPWIRNPKFDFYRNSPENPLSETLTPSRFVSRD